MSTTVWDYVVFFAFLAGCSLIPIYSRFIDPKQKTKAEYVFATGKVSMIAMLLSIVRGSLGVRAFLGFPSELYYMGSAMWETLYGMILAYPIVCFVFVPVYYSLGITSVYQYLDLRFHSRLVRCLASSTYVIRSLLNLSVAVYTPCVALKTVIGIPYWASIMSISFLSIIFNIMGGLKAAIHADSLQGVVMLACGVAIIIQGAVSLKGVAPIFDIPYENGRLDFFNFDLDPTIRVTTVSAVLGQLFMSVSIFGCQQNFVQRYCSMKSQLEVTKTLMANIPLIAVLFSLSWVVGMVIFANYANCDPLSLGYISKIDEIVPFFVQDKFAFLPGFMGLFMASLFNGALSLAVSNLNSLATCTWEDFFVPIGRFSNFSDKKQLLLIKTIGSVYGLIIMFIAYGVSMLNGIIEASKIVLSTTSGPLLGVFLLAMLFPCVNWKGAASGMIVSHMFTLWITFGSLTLDKGPVAMLPLSTDGCTNDSFSRFTSDPAYNRQILIDLSNHSQTEQHFYQYNTSTVTLMPLSTSREKDVLTEIYSITFMYYSLIGCSVALVVGILVSYIVGHTDEDMYDEKLIVPLALKISKYFPGKPRRFTSDSAPLDKMASSPTSTSPDPETIERSTSLGEDVNSVNTSADSCPNNSEGLTTHDNSLSRKNDDKKPLF